MNNGSTRTERGILGRIAIICFGLWLPFESHGSVCAPIGLDMGELLDLKAQGFDIADRERRERFAIDLVDCLDHPDPVIRDGIAYEGLRTLLRRKALEPPVMLALLSIIMNRLQAGEDPLGFRGPFMVLALAEVARVDRNDPFLTNVQRQDLIAVAVTYMTSIDDYRGFDEQDGWRHAVAHAADLLLQLILNPSITEPELIRMQKAIASQVAPPGAHFYIYGESERLARAILYMALRGNLTENQWREWFRIVARPEPFENWSLVFTTQVGLAKLHNTRAFAEAILTGAMASDEASLKPLADGAIAVLQVLP